MGRGRGEGGRCRGCTVSVGLLFDVVAHGSNVFAAINARHQESLPPRHSQKQVRHGLSSGSKHNDINQGNPQ